MAGQGIVNATGLPTSLQIFSASTGTIKLAGQADFYGAIYAPGAYIQYTGQAEIYGAIVGDVIHTSGQGVIHYDEALARIDLPEMPIYEVKSWRYRQSN